jgi:hypothetical protein
VEKIRIKKNPYEISFLNVAFSISKIDLLCQKMQTKLQLALEL